MNNFINTVNIAGVLALWSLLVGWLGCLLVSDVCCFSDYHGNANRQISSVEL